MADERNSREKKSEDMKKEREKREERKKAAPSVYLRQPIPLSEEMQRACALRIQRLVVRFYAYGA